MLRRKRRALSQKCCREKQRERLGAETVRAMERERQRRRYVKVADLPKEELGERRRKSREMMRKYRQTLKLKRIERGGKEET